MFHHFFRERSSGSAKPGRHDHHDHRSHHDHFSLFKLWRAMGRHHGGRGGGFGRHGGFPGGFGADDSFTRGRKLTSEDLQLLLLAFLEIQASHGYELIKAFEARSNGFYKPSPGMVYPALTYLEELGYVDVASEGNRKRYSLVDEGRAYLETHRERAEMMLAKLTHIGHKMDSMRRAFAGQESADENEGDWLPELIEARCALKTALFRREKLSAPEQRRIAAILERATREIEGQQGAEEDGS